MINKNLQKALDTDEGALISKILKAELEAFNPMEVDITKPDKEVGAEFKARKLAYEYMKNALITMNIII